MLQDLDKSPLARKIIKTLHLPIPLPARLKRADGPWRERELDDADVVVAAGPDPGLLAPLAATLARDGATPWIVGGDELADAFIAPGEAWGRSPRHLDRKPADGARYHALIFDASGVSGPDGLRVLFDFFQPFISALAPSGRVLVLARMSGRDATPARGAAQQALDGFVRSVAKEVGRRGSTANLIRVADGGEERLPAVLRFMLSPRSAFMSGQLITVTAEARAAADRPRTRPLDGQVALVTGGARGIGEAIAHQLAGEGAHVVVLDRPEDDGPASRVARAVGGSVLLADVASPDAPELIARHLREAHGGVDVVVHNAGVTRDKTLAKMDAERWDQALGINLRAVVAITAALAGTSGPLRDGGRIVALSSIAGIAGNFGQTNYAASKAGLIGWVQAMAPAMAPRGITVNAVAPGFIETRLTERMPAMTREVVRRMSALSQGGEPRDIAEVVTFLSTPGADGLTGQTVRVCGANVAGA